MNRPGHPKHTGKPRPKPLEMPKGKVPGEPPSSLEVVREAMAAGDWHRALRVASRMSSLGAEKDAIRRAWEALQRPDFQRSIGRDPDVAVEEGKAALRRRFG